MLDLRKNIIDLRREIISFNIKPTDSRHKDFHSALAEYLYKELKTNGLNVSRHQVVLKVALKNKHEDKYEHVVIDCLEGNLYLRGKEISDKYFGRLRRFTGGQRQSDAYHCAIQSASRIISRIQKLQDELNELEREVLGQEIERIDMRTFNRTASLKDLRQRNVTDLRKLASIQRKDLRKTAIDKFALDISFLNDLSTNLQTMYTSVQNIASNNDIQSALNLVSQFGDDIIQNIPMLKNLKPAIDYLANLINGFQTQAPEIIEEIQYLIDPNTSPIRKFRYEMLDDGTFNIAKIIRRDMRKIA